MAYFVISMRENYKEQVGGARFLKQFEFPALISAATSQGRKVREIRIVVKF